MTIYNTKTNPIINIDISNNLLFVDYSYFVISSFTSSISSYKKKIEEIDFKLKDLKNLKKISEKNKNTINLYEKILEYDLKFKKDNDIDGDNSNISFYLDKNSIFINTFIENLDEVITKFVKDFCIEYQNIYFVKDCIRKDIWRNSYTTIEYKGNRKGIENFSRIFYTIAQTKLLEKHKDFNFVEYYNKLECDDVIYIITKDIFTKFKDSELSNIYIMTGDNDYVQFLKFSDKLSIYTRTVKCLVNPIMYDTNTFAKINVNYNEFLDNRILFIKKNLILKIVLGDKSDNIESIYDPPRVKKLDKDINNKTDFVNKILLLISIDDTELETYLKDVKCYEQYLYNNKLINLEEIPNELSEFVKIKYN